LEGAAACAADERHGLQDLVADRVDEVSRVVARHIVQHGAVGEDGERRTAILYLLVCAEQGKVNVRQKLALVAQRWLCSSMEMVAQAAGCGAILKRKSIR